MYGVGFPEFIIIGVIAFMVYLYKKSKNTTDFKSSAESRKKNGVMSRKQYFVAVTVVSFVASIVFRITDAPILAKIAAGVFGFFLFILVVGTILNVDFEMSEKKHIANIIAGFSNEIEKSKKSQ